MLLRFKKRADAGTVLTCVRPDGTWTSGDLGRARGYGPVHDLAHYVVESSLGLIGGFLGLLARGWGFDDFTVGAKDRILREPDSHDAAVAETLAGIISGEAVGGRLSPVEEFNWAVWETMGDTAPTLSAEELAALRARLDTLRGRWDALPCGESLELRFEPGQVAVV